MTKKLLIAGNYGFHNTGDEAILSSMITNLRKLVPNLDICVVSGEPKHTLISFPVEAISWQNISDLIDRVENSDFVVLGGGGIFQDYWGVERETLLTKDHAGLTYYCDIALLANIIKKPLMIYAAGVGPLTTDAGKKMTRLAFDLAQVATVRDEASRRILDSIGVNVENLTVTSDPAFTLIGDKNKASEILSELLQGNEEPFVAVCLRNWDLAGDQTVWQREIAHGLDQLIDTHQFKIIFIPFHNLPEYPLMDDLDIAEQVIALMRNHNRTSLLRGSHAPEVIAGIIAKSKILIGMRLHSIILAANAAIPAIGLVYDPKIKHTMTQLGQDTQAIDLTSLDSQMLVERVNHVWINRKEIAVLLRNKTVNLRQLAFRNTEIIETLLNSEAVPATKSDEWIELLRWLVIKQSRLVQTKEDRVNKFIQENQILSERLLEVNELLIKSMTRADTLKDNLEDAEKKLREKSHTIAEAKEFIDQQNQTITEKERYIQALHEHLDSISVSRGWRFLQFLWDVRLSLVPHGSKREKLLKSLWYLPHKIARSDIFRSKLLPPRIFREGYIVQDNSVVTLYTDDPNLFPDYTPRTPLTNDHVDDIKVSLIACVMNEANNVESWMKDIENQTRLPDEIIIVDGGSMDGTINLLRSRAINYPVSLKVVEAPGSNRSEGRNIAIDHTHFHLIAVTDFGCHIHPTWLEKLIQPFLIDPGTIVSAGFYKCAGASQGRKDQNRLWANLDGINPQTFLPSSRSVAFQKHALYAVGGHPEWLETTGDDTYVDLELKRFGGKWAFVPEALVDWHAPNSLREFLHKHHSWAIGDGESSVHARYYWKYVLHLAGWLLSTLALITLLILFTRIPVRPSILWSMLIITIYAMGAHLIARRSGLNIPLLFQRLLGEFAQVLGFIKGARRRGLVEERKFANIRGVIFILAGVPIDDTGGGSRGAQITNELLRLNYAVVYINKFHKHESQDLGLRFSHPNLFLCQLSLFNWEKFLLDHPWVVKGRKLGAIIEFPLPDFLPLIQHIKHRSGKILYDLLDDWQTSLGGDWYSKEHELKIIQASDSLAATAAPLQSRLESTSQRPVVLIENAVDVNIFNQTASFSRPDDLPTFERIITYTGALWGDWFDWELLVKIAEKYISDLICVIGDYQDHLAHPPHNIIFLGLKRQHDLPAYLAYTDVAIIPWKISRITLATSPLKLYEYLAMGCPVIAPDLQPLRGIPGVWLANNHDEFIKLVGTIDRLSLNESNVNTFIQQNNWEKRVAQLLDLLDLASCHSSSNHKQ